MICNERKSYIFKKNHERERTCFAETEVQIEDGKVLLIKYAPPMITTQPGNNIVSDYNSSSQIKNIISERNHRIQQDEEIDKEKIRKQEETHINAVMIWVIVSIIIVIFYIIEINSIYN